MEIVKQAVHIKLACKNVSPLLSPAEFAYAAGYALRKTETDPAVILEAGEQRSIEDMKKVIAPVLSKAMPEFEKDLRMGRLFHLLLSCKVNGEVTDEIHTLYEMGEHEPF